MRQTQATNLDWLKQSIESAHIQILFGVLIMGLTPLHFEFFLLGLADVVRHMVPSNTR